MTDYMIGCSRADGSNARTHVRRGRKPGEVALVFCGAIAILSPDQARQISNALTDVAEEVEADEPRS